MSIVKEIIVKPIKSSDANNFVKKWHYSGKIVNSSILHFGAFYNNVLHGVMSFGSPLDKRKVLPLVEGTLWNEMLELNRMAFDDYLPKNSESRCISIAFKLIKKHYPHIKWILSFSDGTQCGDGSIYRASGFVLTLIKKNSQIFELQDGTIIHKMNLETTRPTPMQVKLRNSVSMPTGSVNRLAKAIGAEALSGYQLRYIYLLDKSCKLTVPIIPFSKIDEVGAGMYKGEKVKISDRKNDTKKEIE